LNTQNFKTGFGQRHLYRLRRNLSESLRERLAHMPQHLIDRHLAKPSRRVGPERFDASSDRVANRRVV
jgi:hypothetical protein